MATHKTAIDYVFRVVLIFTLSTTCFAAIAWEKAREDPDLPGQCMWEERNGSLGRHLPPVLMFQQGDTWDAGDCIRATCTMMGDELFIQYASCGRIGVEPPCITVPGNRSLPYPDCCPRPWCPELPPQLVEDPSLKTNEIEKGGWEDDSYYQNLYKMFF